MNKRLKALILALTFSFTIFQFKASAFSDTKTNVDNNKEWSVKFNRSLDENTVNSNNIIVKDSTGHSIPVSLKLSQDGYTVFISPKTSGYDPGAVYTVNVGTGVKDVSGVSLSSTGLLKFTIVKKYSDGTDYSNLPNIVSNTFKYTPLVSSEKQGFVLDSTQGENVQYRIFAAEDNQYTDGAFQDITGGYVSPVNGVILANQFLGSGTNGQKYKAIIYVKRANSTGAHFDSNTDYDNYYIDYFRCVSALDVQDGSYYKTYATSLDYGVNKELEWESKPNSGPYFSKGSDFTNLASKNQIKYYMNPDNFLDGYGKYQFLKLSYEDGITADYLNEFLENKGIFAGHGQDFINAGKDNNISVSYLVSHAMLETGNGSSNLAKGIAQNNKTVYNFFGIGAVDGSADASGAKKAYEEGWFTPQLAIEGGAKWLSQDYINNTQYKQDTIYKMRWNPAYPGQHQYATDISWAYNQISNTVKVIESAPELYETVDFEIPKYAK